MSPSGVLVVDKPVGPTSHDVVAFIRRTLRETRVGHTGTLDPLASGVLPLMIGRATRLASLLSSSDKAYEAGVRLGASTETYDAAGLPAGAAPPADPRIERAAIERALDRFRGAFDQMPPSFSAKKVDGVPAYKLARRQRPTALRAARVATRSLEIVALEHGLLTLRMVTTPGFYVRSLAHDLGAALGCGAYLESLRRTRAGPFDLTRAIGLDMLAAAPGEAAAQLIPLDSLCPDLASVRVTAAGALRTAHGNFLRPQDLSESGPDPTQKPEATNGGSGPDPVGGGADGAGPPIRVLGPDGRLLAIARTGADGTLRPSVVLV